MKTHKVRPLLIDSKDNIKEGVLFIDSLRKLRNCTNLDYLAYCNNKENFKITSWETQELVLISLEDEKIEVGDLYIMDEFLMNPVKDENEADRCNNNPSIAPFCKKVIARQSQISLEYISKFVEQYNNGCVKDFEIEMMYKDCPNSSIENWNYFPEPLLTNGFVSIVEKEPITYTEEEVNKLLHKFLDIQEGLNTYQRHASLDVWFEQNKKK